MIVVHRLRKLILTSSLGPYQFFSCITVLRSLSAIFNVKVSLQSAVTCFVITALSVTRFPFPIRFDICSQTKLAL